MFALTRVAQILMNPGFLLIYWYLLVVFVVLVFI
jgi:hypothetical protein